MPLPDCSIRCQRTGQFSKRMNAHAIRMDLVVVFQNDTLCIVEVDGPRGNSQREIKAREQYIRESLGIEVPICRVKFHVKQEWLGKVHDTTDAEQAVVFEKEDITRKLKRVRAGRM